MLKWLWKFWNPAGLGQPPVRTETLQSLIDERRRLEEIRSSYREFGFDDLAQGLREPIRILTERIRALRHSNP